VVEACHPGDQTDRIARPNAGLLDRRPDGSTDVLLGVGIVGRAPTRPTRDGQDFTVEPCADDASVATTGVDPDHITTIHEVSIVSPHPSSDSFGSVHWFPGRRGSTG
jgi:hypothetical protein